MREGFEFNIDERGVWYCQNEEGHCFDEQLCNEIQNIFIENNINKIVDLGCGPGQYVRRLREAGLSCIGYDGNPETPKFSAGICKVLDLSEDFELDSIFECVISLEVGEHIPREYEQTFINNLIKHTSNFLILSWAIPGQGGDGHVNCQTNEYICKEVCSKGFVLDSQLLNRLRNSSSLPWFKDTLLVFRKN